MTVVQPNNIHYIHCSISIFSLKNVHQDFLKILIIEVGIELKEITTFQTIDLNMTYKYCQLFS